MKTYRFITLIMITVIGGLLISSCIPTTETAVVTATKEIRPTDTVEPTNTATAVASSTPTSEPTATATAIPTETPFPTVTPNPTTTPVSSQPEDPFSLAYLVTADQLNTFTEELGIIGWEQEGLDLEWEYRLCRSFLGWSWSANPNIGINCMFQANAETSIDDIAQGLFDQGILYPTAVSLEPNIVYDNETLFYTDQLDNGHAVFDKFVFSKGILYWASISLGTPIGETPEIMFANYGTEIETILGEIFSINIGK